MVKIVKNAKNPKYWSNSNIGIYFIALRYFENNQKSKSNAKNLRFYKNLIDHEALKSTNKVPLL